jgi:uncharacterized membrane protein YpjA
MMLHIIRQSKTEALLYLQRHLNAGSILHALAVLAIIKLPLPAAAMNVSSAE